VDIERHNHEQIETLNQRGGRTLSIVDLIQAGKWHGHARAWTAWRHARHRACARFS